MEKKKGRGNKNVNITFLIRRDLKSDSKDETKPSRIFLEESPVSTTKCPPTGQK